MAPILRGKVGLIFATIFNCPAPYTGGEWEIMSYADSAGFERVVRQQLDYYQRLAGDHPDKFQLVRSRSELQAVLDPWEKDLPGEHPVGLCLLLDNAEGLGSPHLLEEF